MDKGYTRKLAHWLATVRYEDIPPQVTERMKWLILDTLGCGIFGAVLPWSRMATDAIAGSDHSPTATIWGTGRRTSSPHATLLNGTFVQGYELDDAGTQTHAGGSNVTAGLAVAEERGGVSGKALLAAAVLGYEMLFRVGYCMGARGFQYQFRGLHQAGINSPFGAAATAGSLLGLDEDRMFHALGLAGNRGIAWEAVRVSSMDKRMMQGRGGMNGVHAALLAGHGFTGIEDVFETEGGFCRGITQSEDVFDLEVLTRGLGQEWYSPRTELKRYCSMFQNHGYFHAAKLLKEQYDLKPDDIVSFTAVTSPITHSHTNHVYDRTDSETFAQFCIPYGVATMFIDGDTFVDQFTPEKLRDPRIGELARRGHDVEDPSLPNALPPEPRRSTLRVEVKGGQVLEHTLDYGGPDTLMTPEEVTEKFRKLAGRVLPDAQVNRIIEMVGELDGLPDVAALAREMATTPAAAPAAST